MGPTDEVERFPAGVKALNICGLVAAEVNSCPVTKPQGIGLFSKPLSPVALTGP
jgi:hypothetical protein